MEYLLLLKGLELNGMAESDITIKNTPTNSIPQVFSSGQVDAIAAWQPNSGQALKLVPGLPAGPFPCGTAGGKRRISKSRGC